jgi:hypothetical protein
MRSRFLSRTTLIVGILLAVIAGFGCLLIFVSSAKKEIVAELKATDKADEFACEFPPVVERVPPTFGFISWRYTIRTIYDFGADSSGMHYSMECSPPPTSKIMTAIGGVPAGTRTIHFEKAEGILEPYVMKVCLWPLTRKWTFKFPEELPVRSAAENQREK